MDRSLKRNIDFIKSLDYGDIKYKPINYSEYIYKSFIDEFTIEKLKRNIVRYEELKNKIEESINEKRYIHIPISETKEFVSNYYNILVESLSVFINTRDNNFYYLIKAFMNDGREDGNYSFLMPIVINNLLKTCQGICEFYNFIYQSIENNTEGISIEQILLYKSILIAKVQRVFRWYSFDDKEDLCRVTLPPRPHDEQEYFSLLLSYKNLKEINSYEGIGELRTAEKIIQAAEEYFRENNGDVFNVALLGDINYPIKELRNYVRFNINSDFKERKIIYNIYTNNFESKKVLLKDITDINFNSNLFDVFENAGIFSDIIAKNNLIFMLDCLNIYKEPYVSSDFSKRAIIDNYKNNEFDRYSSWMDTPENIFVNNPMDDIYDNIVSLIVFNQIGKIRKNANEYLIEYCKKNILRYPNKNLYIYMSDLDCFKNIDFFDTSYVRTEQYNDKKIGIIKIGNSKSKSISCGSDEKIITFNLWQIIKHIALEERKEITKYIFGDKYEKIEKSIIKEKNEKENNEIVYMLLHYFYFGIDYSNWKSGLSFYYKMDKKLESYGLTGFDEQQICESIINNVLKNIFKRERGSIFRQYCKNVVNSFLYGNARSVNDMVFIHLLKKEIVNLDKFDKAGKLDNLEKYIKEKKNINSKRIYEKIIDNMDTPVVSIANKMTVDSILIDFDGGEGIINNLKKACENLNYENSYLYKNIIKRG